MVEADFIQYYRLDIRDLFDPTIKRANARWTSNLVYQLPDESRVKRRLANSVLTPDQHMNMDVIDLLRIIFYQTQLSASVWMSQSDYKSAMEGSPKSIERPVFEKPKPKFIKGKDAAALVRKQIEAQMTGIKVIDED